MLRQELKRVFKSRPALALSAAVLALSVLMAASTVRSVTAYPAPGETLPDGAPYLTGLDAIEYERQRSAPYEGWLTQERIDRFLAEGAEPVISALRRAQGKDSADYYSARKAYIERTVASRYGEDAAAAALALDESAAEPFYYEYGFGGSDALIDLELVQFAVALVCAATASMTFVRDYSTGAGDILRCARHGRSRLARAKTLGAFIFGSALYFICCGVFTAIVLAAFGTDASAAQLKGESYSILILGGMSTNAQLLLCLLAGWLSVLAVSAFALWLSACTESPVAVFALSVAMAVLPLVGASLLAEGAPGLWLQNILPGGGVCLATGMMQQLSSAGFLAIGSLHIWTPIVMLAAPALETAAFALLARRAYVRHECK